MYKKKISTIAIVTILTLSMLLAAIPMATAAIDGTPDIDIPSGPVGTKPTVSGLTAANGLADPFSTVTLYWDGLSGQVLGTTDANSTGQWSKKVTIPKATAGDHFIVANDGDGAQGVQFTVTSKIVLDPTKGLPGDSVIVTGTGFGDEVDVGIGLGIEATKTDEAVGTGTGTAKAFALDYSPVKPASVTVSAPGIGEDTYITDGQVAAPTTITVTATSITANFTAALYNAAGDTLLDGPTTSTEDNTVVDTVDFTTGVAATTTYTVKITFADETGNYDISDDGNLAGAGVTITIADGAYTVNYATGVITFTTAPASGVPITATYTSYTYGVTPIAGITTNATGSFEAVITIPTTIVEGAYGDYDVTAVDEEANIAPAVSLSVNYYIIVEPDAGPPGINVDVSGRVKPDESVEVKFGRLTSFVTAFTTTSDADGIFSGEYTLPTLLQLATAYTFEAIWDGPEVTTTFTVADAAPAITLVPDTASVGETVTVTGTDFSSKANVTVSFGTTDVNTTKTNGGDFECTFVVPSVATGIYKVTAEDQYGASAEKYFTVVPPPALLVKPRATEYLQGDTISFHISSTLEFSGTIDIEIVDPDGYPFWTVTWTAEEIDSTWIVPYEAQVDDTNGLHLTLPSDAPLGSWNWTATYTITTATTATGLFTVVEPTMQTVLDRLDTMEVSIKGVVTTSEGKIIAVVNTKAGTIMTDLDALEAAIVSIAEGMVTISTSLGEVETTIASLDMGTLGVDITSIKGDVATIKTNIGTVTTSVSNLDAKVTSLSGSVATVSTSLGTLQGTVTSIEGNVATISTDVGTLEADISDISKVDMTPAWLAVVLSLVAAIAAIFAVITIRQKIAG